MSTHEKLYTQRRRTPSFSSILLDAIYRSTDESKSNLDEDQPMGTCRDSLCLKQSNVSHSKHGRHGGVSKERMDLRSAVMLEDWLEKQSYRSSSCLNSSSSSSGSSYGGVFSSSSENESRNRSKPERGFKNSKFETSEKKQQQLQKPDQGGFAKTKLRALKFYGELNRKLKQPISPGSRLASFINSIFNSGNVKKAKMCYVGAAEDVSFEQKSKSPCFSASASSFSRSCMSKTPSARGKSSNGVKRSVRFYPVSMILGEDSHTPNHRVYANDPSLMPSPTIRKCRKAKELNNYATEKGNSAEAVAVAVAVARDYLRDYRNQSTSKSVFRSVYDSVKDEDDEEDARSYSSSDLFELDHVIGTARYHEELPVYGTTSLGNNKAIANGLILQPSIEQINAL